LLDLLLERCRQGGGLKAHGRQRTDSTHILAKIRSLSRTLRVARIDGLRVECALRSCP
jgi:transposase